MACGGIKCPYVGCVVLNCPVGCCCCCGALLMSTSAVAAENVLASVVGSCCTKVSGGAFTIEGSSVLVMLPLARTTKSAFFCGRCFFAVCCAGGSLCRFVAVQAVAAVVDVVAVCSSSSSVDEEFGVLSESSCVVFVGDFFLGLSTRLSLFLHTVVPCMGSCWRYWA